MDKINERFDETEEKDLDTHTHTRKHTNTHTPCFESEFKNELLLLYSTLS